MAVSERGVAHLVEGLKTKEEKKVKNQKAEIEEKNIRRMHWK
jgi:hypothetical protein